MPQLITLWGFSWLFKIKYPDKHAINTLMEECIEETYRLFGSDSHFLLGIGIIGKS